MIKILIDNVLREKNKTRYWLVKNTGVNFETISHLANGETTSIKFDTLNKICSTLECGVGDIIKFEKEG